MAVSMPLEDSSLHASTVLCSETHLLAYILKISFVFGAELGNDDESKRSMH